jgi:hypothetical protein
MLRPPRSKPFTPSRELDELASYLAEQDLEIAAMSPCRLVVVEHDIVEDIARSVIWNESLDTTHPIGLRASGLRVDMRSRRLALREETFEIQQVDNGYRITTSFAPQPSPIYFFVAIVERTRCWVPRVSDL